MNVFQRSHWAVHALLTAGLCLVIWLTYWPSLRHAARDDQWNFLTDTRYQHHFKRLILRNYAYNRTSEMARGDYPLFRPVLFGLLAGEKALFDHHYVWWQAVGIAVHCAVVCVFLTLLLRLDRLGWRPGFAGDGAGGMPAAGDGGVPARFRLRTLAAYGLALFFALDVAVMELVIYHHLTAYMLFLLCELGVMVLVVDLLSDTNGRAGVQILRVGGAFLLALVAAFTYEIGQCFAVVVGLVLGTAAWHGGKRRQAVVHAALFCSILFLFQFADRAHRLIHPPRAIDLGESTILTEACSPVTLVNVARYLTFCLVQPLFPSCIDAGFESRLVVPEPAVVFMHYRHLDAPLVASLLVVACAVALAVMGLRRIDGDRYKRARMMVILLAASFVLLHMSIIVLGRLNMRPRPSMLSRNSYYAYFPFAMLLVALHALWSSTPAVQLRRERLAGLLHAVVAAGLLMLSFVSAQKVHAMSVKIANEHRPIRSTIKFLDGLVRLHGSDERFGMAFTPEAWRRLDSFGDRYVLRVPLPVIICPQHVNDKDPTHVVTFVDGRWQALSVEEYDGVWRLNPP